MPCPLSMPDVSTTFATGRTFMQWICLCFSRGKGMGDKLGPLVLFNPLWFEPCAMHKCHLLKLKENGSDPTSILSFRCIPNDGCSKNTPRGVVLCTAYLVWTCGKTCMLSINRHKVNNSTQLNFTIRTGNGGHREVVYLGWPIAPSFMMPQMRGQWVNDYSCALPVKPKWTFEI